MSFFEDQEREAMRLRHEDRVFMSTLGPSCHRCDEPAVARLVFLRGTNEESRTPPKCRFHYYEALNVWDRLNAVAPEAVTGLQLTVSGA